MHPTLPWARGPVLDDIGMCHHLARPTPHPSMHSRAHAHVIIHDPHPQLSFVTVGDDSLVAVWVIQPAAIGDAPAAAGTPFRVDVTSTLRLRDALPTGVRWLPRDGAPPHLCVAIYDAPALRVFTR